MDKPDNPQAFPASASWRDENPEIITVEQQGMTLRDYFAAKAMQQLLAMQHEGMVAYSSYKMADAMLKERNA